MTFVASQAHVVAGLGHVGLYCDDPVRQLEFYSGVLGLHVTDRDDDRKMYFLSARPQEEHHELLLVPGRNASSATRVVQQVSFYCSSIVSLLEIYQRLLRSTATIDATVTHGNALSVYYYDPEGNRSEVYWPTGLQARQPFYKVVDLEREPKLIVAEIERAVEQFGRTGVDDRPRAGSHGPAQLSIFPFRGTPRSMMSG